MLYYHDFIVRLCTRFCTRCAGKISQQLCDYIVKAGDLFFGDAGEIQRLIEAINPFQNVNPSTSPCHFTLSSPRERYESRGIDARKRDARIFIRRTELGLFEGSRLTISILFPSPDACTFFTPLTQLRVFTEDETQRHFNMVPAFECSRAVERRAASHLDRF